MARLIIIVTDDIDATAIYKDGKYLGKNDQIDPWQLLVDCGVATKIVVAENRHDDLYNLWGLSIEDLRSFGVIE